MALYIRKSKNSGIEGPFSIEQINEMVRLKRFTAHSLVIPDAGKGFQAVLNAPIKEWTELADAPGFEPDPKAKRGCLTVMVVAIILYGAIVIIGLVKLVSMVRRIQ